MLSPLSWVKFFSLVLPGQHFSCIESTFLEFYQHFSHGYTVLKSPYLLKGKLPLHLLFLFFFFSMDKCISLTMGLGGWMTSCLRQKLLKPCCILVKELPNVHLIKWIILTVIDPTHLQAISASSWVVRSVTAKHAGVTLCLLVMNLTGHRLGLHTPSFYPAANLPCGLLGLPSQELEELSNWPSFLFQPLPLSIAIRSMMREIEVMNLYLVL